MAWGETSDGKSERGYSGVEAGDEPAMDSGRSPLLVDADLEGDEGGFLSL